MNHEILNDAETRMKKSVEAFRHELVKIRTGKASTALLDGIRVDYYGTQVPLNQVASLSTPEPRLIIIQPWDKGMIGKIEKEILKSDLGLNPVNDGTFIRLAVPMLTEERRKDLVKLVRKYAEESRVAIRNIRRDTNEHLKREEKDSNISEDDLKKLQTRTQELTDKYIKNIDEVLDKKEKEIMEV
ncbi:MAG: ribosome recycling factor [Candidatus Zixiibacteriota bacterium]|nr:MAG: ribosome recycling factor [candidate division Zixibacteria bacterium]